MSQQAGAPRMATVDPAAQDNYIYNRLLKERIIWLGSEVRDENANAICSQLLLLSAENPDKDIYLYINSPGGSVTAGMAVYDTMQYIPNDVVTIGMGMAASMGQFLLTGGTAGKRFALPNTDILMHQGSAGIGGTASLTRSSRSRRAFRAAAAPAPDPDTRTAPVPHRISRTPRHPATERHQ